MGGGESASCVADRGYYGPANGTSGHIGPASAVKGGLFNCAADSWAPVAALPFVYGEREELTCLDIQICIVKSSKKMCGFSNLYVFSILAGNFAWVSYFFLLIFFGDLLFIVSILIFSYAT